MASLSIGLKKKLSGQGSEATNILKDSSCTFHTEVSLPDWTATDCLCLTDAANVANDPQLALSSIFFYHEFYPYY